MNILSFSVVATAFTITKYCAFWTCEVYIAGKFGLQAYVAWLCAISFGLLYPYITYGSIACAYISTHGCGMMRKVVDGKLDKRKV